jgi:zinc protease
MRSTLAALFLAGSVGAAAAQTAAAPIKPLPFTRFVLPNGLTVILNEDHASPVAAVDIYYRYGWRDDRPGRTAVSHICEHMMGEGSPNLGIPQSVFYRSIGGTSPHAAETGQDITHYNVSVPANQLETVIWVEADRLANPLSRADSARTAAVKAVIAQERLVQYENIPAGAQREVVIAALYPETNPYHMGGLSPMPDLPSITAADLRDQCLPYYVPNNAVLAISGNFNSATVRGWVEKYFGPIARRPDPKHAPVPPLVINGERRLVLEDYRITAPRIYFQWAGASYDDPDRMGLLVLASSLSLSRFASNGHLALVNVEPPTTLGRLTKLLVNDRRLATRVIVDNYDEQHTGIFEIAVFPQPNASLTLIETLVDSVVTSLATAPITTEEIAVFNAYNSVLLPTSLQPRFARADTLAHDEVFAGDPAAYAKQAIAAQKLTPADMQRIVKRFMVPGHSVLSIVPQGKLDLIAKPSAPYTNVTPPFALKR